MSYSPTYLLYQNTIGKGKPDLKIGYFFIRQRVNQVSVRSLRSAEGL